MEVKIIRGHRLKLWKDRLNLAPDFIEILEPSGINYVHMEMPMENSVKIVLLAQTKGKEQVLPVVLVMDNETAEALIERIDLDV